MSELEKAATQRIKQAQAERSQLADELSALGRLRLLQERCGAALSISPGSGGRWFVHSMRYQFAANGTTPLKAVEAAERALMANGANTDD